MATRQLTKEEIEKLALPLISELRDKLQIISGGDSALKFALRRKITKELIYDERGKPMHRRKLKDLKRAKQDNKCAVCGRPLPVSHNVLDRLVAMDGYTEENTRLICQDCDIRIQKERGYT